jgi:hypothetical protein
MFDPFHGSACNLNSVSSKHVQASPRFIETRGCVVGLMEARGIAGFDRGNARTNWIFWNRIKSIQHFPDVCSIPPTQLAPVHRQPYTAPTIQAAHRRCLSDSKQTVGLGDAKRGYVASSDHIRIGDFELLGPTGV